RYKGFGEPVSAWRVIRKQVNKGRFDARRAAGLTPYVGRTKELETLSTGWRLAKEGRGQVLLIDGEPGIGKSRLVEEFCEHISVEPQLRIDYIGSPFHCNSPLSPVIAQIERSARFADQDSVECKRIKLQALFDAQSNSLPDDAVLLLASFISFPLPPPDPPLDPDRQRRKRRTFNVIIDQICLQAAIAPILLF